MAIHVRKLNVNETNSAGSQRLALSSCHRALLCPVASFGIICKNRNPAAEHRNSDRICKEAIRSAWMRLTNNLCHTGRNCMQKMRIQSRDRNLSDRSARSDALAATNLVFQKPPCSVSALSNFTSHTQSRACNIYDRLRSSRLLSRTILLERCSWQRT